MGKTALFLRSLVIFRQALTSITAEMNNPINFYREYEKQSFIRNGKIIVPEQLIQLQFY